MTQADTGPTRPAPARFPLGPVIFVALVATLALGGGIAYVWSEGWLVVGIASLVAAVPVGAVLMYRVMTRLSTHHDRPENPRATRRLLLGFATAGNVVAIGAVWLHLLSAGIGFAGGIMLGLFWWMVDQRSATVDE